MGIGRWFLGFGSRSRDWMGIWRRQWRARFTVATPSHFPATTTTLLVSRQTTDEGWEAKPQWVKEQGQRSRDRMQDAASCTCTQYGHGRPHIHHKHSSTQSHSQEDLLPHCHSFSGSSRPKPPAKPDKSGSQSNLSSQQAQLSEHIPQPSPSPPQPLLPSLPVPSAPTPYPCPFLHLHPLHPCPLHLCSLPGVLLAPPKQPPPVLSFSTRDFGLCPSQGDSTPHTCHSKPRACAHVVVLPISPA